MKEDKKGKKKIIEKRGKEESKDDQNEKVKKMDSQGKGNSPKTKLQEKILQEKMFKMRKKKVKGKKEKVKIL